MGVKRQLCRVGTDRRAVTALEYALIAAFTAMLALTGFALFDNNMSLTYGKISGTLDPSIADGPSPTASPPASTAANGSTGSQPACESSRCGSQTTTQSTIDSATTK